MAFTKEVDRHKHDGILGGQRDEGQQLRNFLSSMNAWDAVSPFTARLATDSGDCDYNITAAEYLEQNSDLIDDESVLIFQLISCDGDTALIIPPPLQ